MTAKLSSQTRLIAVLGLALILAFAAMMVVRGGLLDSSDEEVAALPADAPTVTPAPSKTPKAAPTIKILPGVPSPVANALQRSRVVVAALVGGASTDRVRIAQARAGARSVGAAFVTLDVRKESQARAVAAFVEPGSDASVLVVSRPGRIANSFAVYADQAIVAQAAVNAGARKPKAVATKTAAGSSAKRTTK